MSIVISWFWYHSRENLYICVSLYIYPPQKTKEEGKHQHKIKASVVLGVLAALLEDYILSAGPRSVRGNWPLWSSGGLPWSPEGLPWSPVVSRCVFLAVLSTSWTKISERPLVSPVVSRGIPWSLVFSGGLP